MKKNKGLGVRQERMGSPEKNQARRPMGKACHIAKWRTRPPNLCRGRLESTSKKASCMRLTTQNVGVKRRKASRERERERKQESGKGPFAMKEPLNREEEEAEDEVDRVSSSRRGSSAPKQSKVDPKWATFGGWGTRERTDTRKGDQNQDSDSETRGENQK